MTRPPTRTDWLLTGVVITVYTVLLAGSALVLLPNHWYAWGLLLVVGLAALVG